MATIKEIAQAVGVSSSAVSRVLNYDDKISVSDETRDAIFKKADELGYKKKVIYPKIENVVLLYWIDQVDELEDIYYQNICDEVVRQAKKMNIDLSVIKKEQGFTAIPADAAAFVAIGWMNRKDINRLYSICKKGIFIGTTPDEKLFDAVKPNLDSFVTQIVDYFIEKGYKTIGFVGGTDRNIDTGKPSMDVREWSFRQSALYYGCLDEKSIYLADKNTVKEGYRIGNEIANRKDNIPRALCVSCDTLAVGLLQSLNEAGVRVPDDVAVFSINDIHISRYVSPPLTTFHIDIPVICETALELLQSRVLNDVKVTKTVFVNGKPVYRKSC
jgi:LacI family transcriptional regulator